MKFLTVTMAKEEIRRLQHFIQVVESYEVDSLENGSSKNMHTPTVLKK